MAKIPAVALAYNEYMPVEDIVAAALRPRLGGIPVQTLIEDGVAEAPFVLVRRSHTLRTWEGDMRGLLDMAYVNVHCFTEDLDGDLQAAQLSEACRVALRDAVRNGFTIRDKQHGRVHLSSVRLVAEPRRAADWATATGPVQYADLPTGYWRYETLYRVCIRYDR